MDCSKKRDCINAKLPKFLAQDSLPKHFAEKTDILRKVVLKSDKWMVNCN